MSREHGRSRACEAEAAEGTGVAVAQATDMTAAAQTVQSNRYTAAKSATYEQLFEVVLAISMRSALHETAELHAQVHL
jgi:hypothetical protein